MLSPLRWRWHRRLRGGLNFWRWSCSPCMIEMVTLRMFWRLSRNWVPSTTNRRGALSVLDVNLCACQSSAVNVTVRKRDVKMSNGFTHHLGALNCSWTQIFALCFYIHLYWNKFIFLIVIHLLILFMTNLNKLLEIHNVSLYNLSKNIPSTLKILEKPLEPCYYPPITMEI